MISQITLSSNSQNPWSTIRCCPSFLAHTNSLLTSHSTTTNLQITITETEPAQSLSSFWFDPAVKKPAMISGSKFDCPWWYQKPTRFSKSGNFFSGPTIWTINFHLTWLFLFPMDLQTYWDPIWYQHFTNILKRPMDQQKNYEKPTENYSTTNKSQWNYKRGIF